MGEIYLIEFDPARGHEIQKTRPALTIQNNIGNKHCPVTIVAAITSNLSPTPHSVEVMVPATWWNGLTSVSAIKLSQIRFVDRQRWVKRVGLVDAPTMRKADEDLMISLGTVDF